MEIKRATSYRVALALFPRWIYPAGHKMRREGAPKIYKE